jgi:cell division protein FtsL
VSTGAVKLRSVFVWMGVMSVVALLAVAHLSKQHLHSRLSREVIAAARERDALSTEVLLLETETRGLHLYSRLETVARERLGLINPGTPVMIQPAGQVMASTAPEEKAGEKQGGTGTPIRAARWRGFFR